MDPRLISFERKAERLNRQLIAIIDRRILGDYITLGTVGLEYEQLSEAELEELKSLRGERLLVVMVDAERDAEKTGGIFIPPLSE